MAWLAAPTENGTIETSVKYLTERLYSILTGAKFSRTRTITTTNYVGLTNAAAKTQATTSAAKTNCTDAHVEPTGGLSFQCVEVIDAVTDWAEDLPAAPMPPEAAAKARGVLASINAGERAKRGAQANHGGPDRHAAAVYDKTGKA